MFLNVHEINVILFNLHGKHVLVDNLTICINSYPVMQVTNINFLGIYNENLSWKYHINYIKLNLSRNIGFIIKILYLLHSKSVKNCTIHYPIYILYILYIHYPYLSHGNILLASTYSINA